MITPAPIKRGFATEAKDEIEENVVVDDFAARETSMFTTEQFLPDAGHWHRDNTPNVPATRIEFQRRPCIMPLKGPAELLRSTSGYQRQHQHRPSFLQRDRINSPSAHKYTRSAIITLHPGLKRQNRVMIARKQLACSPAWVDAGLWYKFISVRRLSYQRARNGRVVSIAHLRLFGRR